MSQKIDYVITRNVAKKRLCNNKECRKKTDYVITRNVAKKSDAKKRKHYRHLQYKINKIIECFNDVYCNGAGRKPWYGHVPTP